MTNVLLPDHLIVAVIAVYAVFALLRGRKGMSEVEFDTPTKLAMYWSNAVVLWVAAAAVVAAWLYGGRSLASLGLTPAHRAPLAGAAIALALAAWFVAETAYETATPARRKRTLAKIERLAPFFPRTRREFAHFNGLAVTAGVTEEIVFRGFLISYLVAFVGESPAGLAVAVIAPALLFTMGHAYEGWSAALRVLVLALGFGAFFVATGSILVPIVLHALVDVVMGTVAWRLAREQTLNAIG